MTATARDNPAPARGEVLIRVRAAALNPLDWRTKSRRPGRDVAGQVESVGPEVARFEPGDEVFGVCRGACAEYATAREAGLVVKPAQVTFEQAAAAPVAGFTALQALRDKGRIQAGEKVLVNGAAGGVGTFAVQIAKAFGAEVTGVTSTRNVDLVRSIGADHIVDYTRDDFTTRAQRYDLILDCVGNHSMLACRRVLTGDGRYVTVGGITQSIAGLLARWAATPVLSRLAGHRFVMFIASSNADDLRVLGEMMATGKVTPVIDRRYPLSEVGEAIRYLHQGHARGKVLITVA